MLNNNIEPEGFDIDVEKEFVQAEEGATANLLREAGALMEPHPQFAEQLEARLRLATQPAAQRAQKEEVVTGAHPVSGFGRWRQGVLGRPGVRMSFVGAGLAVAVLMVAVLGLSALLNRNTEVRSTSKPAEFAPAGQVRHIILSGTYTITGTNGLAQTHEEHHEEFWLTPGKDHLLMRTLVTAPITTMTWLDDDAYYEYEPATGNVVYKYPYDDKYLASVAPDHEIITKTLQLPNAHLLGDDILDGRPVVVIEAGGGLVPTPGAKGLSPYTNVNSKYWIDKQTNQLLQLELVSTTVGGPSNGVVERRLNKTVLNELKPASEFPSNYFSFILPEGAQLMDAPQSATVGAATPDFELNDVRTGQPLKLSSLRGKPVVLFFWGTWCPPCRNTLPAVQKMYDRTKGMVEFVAVSFGPRDTSATTVKNFIDQNGYDWTFLYNPQRSGGYLLSTYNIASVPSFYFIDERGIIRDVNIGQMDEAALEKSLHKILAFNPPGIPASNPPGWYTFTAPYGAFSVLMPRQATDIGGNSSGVVTFGLKDGDMTYIVTYQDYSENYSEVTDQTDPDKWLDQNLAAIVASMKGRLGSQTPIKLGIYPGRELEIERTDGRFTRSRIYLAGKRLYNVYAIASVEKSLFADETNKYLDSFKLLGK